MEIGSLGASECAWHTDMSYNPEPADASALYALEVPEAGGDTAFLNMYKAHDALPDSLKERIGGRKAIHDATFTRKAKHCSTKSGTTPPTTISSGPINGARATSCSGTIAPSCTGVMISIRPSAV